MCPTLVAIRRLRTDWVFETNTPAVARPRACFRFTSDFTAPAASARPSSSSSGHLMWHVWQPLLAAALAIAAGRPSAHARAPQPVAHIKNKIADWRYRKSTGLYERLAQGRESVTAAPVSKPVLLAPAGGWPQVDAAIKAGADAIYFGCATGFNARARATNFGEEELPVLMEKLHTAGLEGYMCLNVLVYESEMAEAERLARAAEAAGVDGLIVQDVGVASRLRAVAPTLAFTRELNFSSAVPQRVHT